MGNICGKSESEAFSQPGRVLGSAPPQPQSVPVPAHVGGPPRTLGGASPLAEAQAQGDNRAAAADDARTRAAEAAEARAQATAAKSSGKLGSQLAAQKKQTRNETLQEISNNERRQRDADEAAQARNHN
ncbi:hypothetical protein F5B22DRAFT_404084 [Xylaria bambusicola]|uniref:uncharacterized protein n=1 Tax=Xylaria bambusicola TaxID=326684 RepID=UPI0020086E58|nr:uncharacterized protein F5B22DRAFT_404084 [Xylaria bambusicola]KAI0508396.1 hypothetical protein F5B22DRAFT_404084 [Xylaria bambusicola]